MKVFISDLLEQWYESVEYAKTTLSLARISYLVTWQKLFTTPGGEGSNRVLLMITLLFTVPVSNAKLERMFSKLKRVKTNFRGSIGVKQLENILRAMEEGSSWETFDPISAVKKWGIDTVRRTIKEKISRNLKSRNSAKVNVKSLSDDGSYDEEENISENGDEETAAVYRLIVYYAP